MKYNPKYKLYLPHHSTADWDFQKTTWYLDTTQFTSAPSSLRSIGAETTVTPWVALCKASVTIPLDEGRIVSQIRRPATGSRRPLLVFRAQAPIGTATYYNCYCVRFSDNPSGWEYYDALGVRTIIANIPYALPTNTWVKVRISWWNGKNLQNQDATVLRVERWDGANWIQIDVDYYDTNQRNKGSPNSRVGVGCWNALNSYSWHDDTEVWGYP